jgi:hypothetical protein
VAQGIIDIMTENNMEYDCVVECFTGIGGLTLPLNTLIPPHIPFISSDKDKGVIGFLKAVQNGWSPPTCEISREEFDYLKSTKEEKTPMHVVVGHGSCFNGKYFADHFQDYTNDKLAAACRKINKLRHLTYGIEFYERDYQFYNPKQWVNTLFVCDSPYRLITNYYDCQLSKNFQGFNFLEYFDWVRNMSQNNYVLCCEYEMDSDFTSVWEFETIHNNKTSLSGKKLERLFIWNDPSSLFVQNYRYPTFSDWKSFYTGPYLTIQIYDLKTLINPFIGTRWIYFNEKYGKNIHVKIPLENKEKFINVAKEKNINYSIK